ncbi:nitrogenase [Opitutaceae bacterium EW11]|nr:nitrogenase [Opitutaceae bacterium EW11]
MIPAAEFPSAATNACKLCTPLGACLAFKGVEGAIPFLHGSQGCATYIRRYLISHFREPMDIAASNFSEQSAVFGGGANLKTGLANVVRQYQPRLVGLATTCLSETIGEDVPLHLREFAETAAGPVPPVVHVSTASYRGTHMDGFNDAVRALVEAFAGTDTIVRSDESLSPAAVFPGMVSPSDLRELKRLGASMGIPFTLLPDYSETLDGPTWSDYEKLPAGGTSVSEIRRLSSAQMAIEFGRILAGAETTAGVVLERRHQVPLHRLGLPIGLRETDRFLQILSRARKDECRADVHSSGRSRCAERPNTTLCILPSGAGGLELPSDLALERGRLIDSWVDGHKYVFGKRAVVFGEEDLAVGLTSLLAEIGIVPVLVASGGKSGRFAGTLRAAIPELDARTAIRESADFSTIAHEARQLRPDLLVGNSKGYGLARELGIPLIRCGFPVHDRIGGQRLLHLGYAGAQQLFDRIVNALLEDKQTRSPVGYSYL